MNQSTTQRFRRTSVPMVLVLMASVLFAAPVHAQDATTEGEAAYLAKVSEAGQAVQDRIDAAFEASEGECVGLAQEACLQHFLAPDLTTTAQEMDAYADLLSTLATPARFSDDVAAHVASLRQSVDHLSLSVEAATAGDRAALDESAVLQANLYTQLIAELDPAYVDAAFVSGLGPREDWLDGPRDLVNAEFEYLADLRDSRLVAAPNFDCVNVAITRAYGDTVTLLTALANCGAGDSLAAIETAVRQLEPPPRFAEEHAWWLGALADSVPYDRLIGEAANSGDIVSFLVNNARMVRVQRLEPWLDPTFVDAISQGGAPRPLGSSEPLAQTDYGRELHAAVTAYSIDDPFSVLITTLDFPQVPREEALPAITELAAGVLDTDAALYSALEAVAPPEEFAGDHAALLAFFREYTRAVESIEVAATGDEAATFAIQAEAEQAFCDAQAGFSDAIRPAVEPFFGTNPPQCA